jgi:hypothetical protein
LHIIRNISGHYSGIVSSWSSLLREPDEKTFVVPYVAKVRSYSLVYDHRNPSYLFCIRPFTIVFSNLGIFNYSRVFNAESAIVHFETWKLSEGFAKHVCSSKIIKHLINFRKIWREFKIHRNTPRHVIRLRRTLRKFNSYKLHCLIVANNATWDIYRYTIELKDTTNNIRRWLSENNHLILAGKLDIWNEDWSQYETVNLRPGPGLKITGFADPYLCYLHVTWVTGEFNFAINSGKTDLLYKRHRKHWR